jgi:hypothetical protein
MQEKIPTLFFYGLIGLIIAFAPTLVHNLQSKNKPLTIINKVNPNYLGIIAILLTVVFLYLINIGLKNGYVYVTLIVSLLFGFFYQVKERKGIQGFSASFLACAAISTLPWWRRPLDELTIDTTELLYFTVLLISIVFLLLRTSRQNPVRSRYQLAFLGIYPILAAYFCYSLATTESSEVFLTQWHHWGAFVDPVLAVRDGLRLLHDIPAQYGAGPTTILNLVCGSDCWFAAYWTFSTAAFCYAILIGCILLMIGGGDRFHKLLILFIGFLTCIFWNAYPPALLSPNVAPSTSGIRFLPVLSLVTWMLFSSKRDLSFKNEVSHTLWFIGAIWSPESLFYVTAVWWPVYIYESQFIREKSISRNIEIIRACSHLFILLCIALIVVLLIYYLNYKVLPVPKYFIAYMLYPPGQLPINWHGTIWYFLFSFTLSVYVSWVEWRKDENVIRFKRSLTLQLLSFSTLAYYLGRCHDNNVLNVLPFIFLMLIDAFRYKSSVFIRQSIAIALASIVAWLAVFGFGFWDKAYKEDKLISYNFSLFRSKLDYHNADTQLDLINKYGYSVKAQLEQTVILMDLISKRDEKFIILDQFYLIQPNYPSGTWSAIQSATNLHFFPSQMRREFLNNVAIQSRGSGWIIISRNQDLNGWIEDFDFVYNRSEQIDLEDVYAIRFSPKTH